MSDSIVVYKSRSQQIADEMIWDFIENNPEFVLMAIKGFFIISFIAVCIYLAYQYKEKRARKAILKKRKEVYGRYFK